MDDQLKGMFHRAANSIVVTPVEPSAAFKRARWKKTGYRALAGGTAVAVIAVGVLFIRPDASSDVAAGVPLTFARIAASNGVALATASRDELPEDARLNPGERMLGTFNGRELAPPRLVHVTAPLLDEGVQEELAWAMLLRGSEPGPARPGQSSFGEYLTLLFVDDGGMVGLPADLPFQDFGASPVGSTQLLDLSIGGTASVPTAWEYTSSTGGLHYQLGLATSNNGTALEGLVEESSGRVSINDVSPVDMSADDAYVQVSASYMVTRQQRPSFPKSFTALNANVLGERFGEPIQRWSGEGGDGTYFDVVLWVGPGASPSTAARAYYVIRNLDLPLEALHPPSSSGCPELLPSKGPDSKHLALRTADYWASRHKPEDAHTFTSEVTRARGDLQGPCRRDGFIGRTSWERTWIANIRWEYRQIGLRKSASVASSTVFLGRTAKGWRVYHQFH